MHVFSTYYIDGPDVGLEIAKHCARMCEQLENRLTQSARKTSRKKHTHTHTYRRPFSDHHTLIVIRKHANVYYVLPSSQSIIGSRTRLYLRRNCWLSRLITSCNYQNGSNTQINITIQSNDEEVYIYRWRICCVWFCRNVDTNIHLRALRTHHISAIRVFDAGRNASIHDMNINAIDFGRHSFRTITTAIIIIIIIIIHSHHASIYSGNHSCTIYTIGLWLCIIWVPHQLVDKITRGCDWRALNAPSSIDWIYVFEVRNKHTWCSAPFRLRGGTTRALLFVHRARDPTQYQAPPRLNIMYMWYICKWLARALHIYAA